MTSSRTRCTATTARGTPCKAWAVSTSDPPRCGAHGGGTKQPGAPTGNSNALTHGAYTRTATPASIAEIIDDLAAKQARISAYIDSCIDDGLPVDTLAHLLALHGQNASRLGRLLRDQRALSGEAADGIAGAIAQALDELSNELGAPL